MHDCLTTKCDSAENLHASTRTVTGCDNKQVSIQWPCNIQYDMVKRMTLTVTKSQSKVEHIASITSDGNVTIPQRYTKHVRARGTSGVLLTEAAVLDSGQYLTEVEYWNGSLIYEDFFVCIYGGYAVPILILNAHSIRRQIPIHINRLCFYIF